MGFGPYKCPDCKVWWAGFEHRCVPGRTTTTTNIPVGHCHGCSSAWCTQADDVPCMIHQGGYTITYNNFNESV